MWRREILNRNRNWMVHRDNGSASSEALLFHPSWPVGRYHGIIRFRSRRRSARYQGGAHSAVRPRSSETNERAFCLRPGLGQNRRFRAGSGMAGRHPAPAIPRAKTIVPGMRETGRLTNVRFRMGMRVCPPFLRRRSPTSSRDLSFRRAAVLAEPTARLNAIAITFVTSEGKSMFEDGELWRQVDQTPGD